MSLPILGTTAKIVSKKIFEDSKKPMPSFFFKPFTSSGNGVIRTTSIISDLPILGITSAVVALMAGVEFLKAIGNLVTGNVKISLENLKGTGAMLLISAVIAVAALFSPIINTIDLIGGVINSAPACCVCSDEQRSPQLI
ncbi:hypothetical protein [Legionella cardiaca]|uniref:Uncharacterized protein n=1 Tax=Legionella cardiaca TaxID=1071983 RepID=A0ABY8AV12_9GAMM|nr:hypothetical protein [Legionella cardiaca]WED43584.1 hypothetical protein PXX05_02060 [Legionella cardiaca]